MKTTLQSRLITSIVILIIVLIAAFTAIQLYNQLQRSGEFNLYKANVGALATKDKLQHLFSNLEPDHSPRTLLAQIRKVFSNELEAGVIEEAHLLNTEARRLLSVGKIVKDVQYDKNFLNEISQLKYTSKWLFPVVDKENQRIDLFIVLDNPYDYIAQLGFSLGGLQQAFYDVYRPVLSTVVVVILAGILFAVLLSRTLVSPVKILNKATKDIAQGDLDRKVSIQTKDELEELAGTFNVMTTELKKMKAKAENANPLTKLPGNIVIQEEVEKKIKNNEKFVLIYCDLDNFKAFNDKYGVHAGDEAIMMTAEIFRESVKKENIPDCFIGHEGGDDFLLLTSPEHAQKVTDYIIKEFDPRIRKLYSQEDLDRGVIEAKSREGDHIREYPIMTISLAGVTNVHREIVSYSQVTNIAAEVKNIAKKKEGSNFFMDQRKEDLGPDKRA